MPKREKSHYIDTSPVIIYPGKNVKGGKWLYEERGGGHFTI